MIHNTIMQEVCCVFLSVLLSSNITNAQVNYEDVVYLKNGSVIHGMIIEQVPNESITIKTNSKDVILFRLVDVLKMTREEITSVNPEREPLTDHNIKTNGFTNITEFVFGRDKIGGDNISSPSGTGNMPSLGFQTINGYMFNPHLSVGFGIGIHNFYDIGYVPIFADARYNVVKGTITPFISFDGGYSFTTEEITHGKEPNFHGGPYFNLSLGMKFYTRKTNALAFSFGYNYQQFETSVTEDNFYYPDTKQYWVKEQLEYMAMKFSFVF